MILEIANNLLNKDGICIAVLCTSDRHELLMRSSIYSHIKQELFAVKHRSYAKLVNKSRIYFINIKTKSSEHVLRGLKIHKVYCNEILTTEQTTKWYTSIAPHIYKYEPLGAEFEKI